MRQKTLFLLLITCFISSADYAYSQEKGFIIEQPIHLNRDGVDLKGKDCLILVPENRQKADSRLIPVHFYLFPAAEPNGMPPVFYLPGGPGSSISGRHFYRFFGGKRAEAFVGQIKVFNQHRDLIILNQRGHSEAPGFQIHQFKFWQPNGKREEALNLTALYEQTVELMQESKTRFQELGIDTDGYNIIEMTKDIESIRKALDYQQIALVGSSFGSQWALSYVQLFQEHVDRVLLSGIEPLDHTIDDPQDVWKVYQRLAKLAEVDPNLNSDLPKVGLENAIKEIAQRLENKPVKVHLQIPEEGIDEYIPIGKDDFISHLQYPFADSRQASLTYWPKYITEIYQGDYRNLALWAYEERKGYEFELLMPNLIDNSIGISPTRKKELAQRVENAWMTNQLDFFRLTQEARLSPDAGDSFRNPINIEVPILIIQGDLDWSTPLENAHYLMPYLKNAHLLEVKGGTHDVNREIYFQNPNLAKDLNNFINVDFEKVSFQSYLKKLPSQYSLPTIKFIPIKKKPLFEMLLEED